MADCHHQDTRKTRQRRAITCAIEGLDRAFTVDELVDEVRQHDAAVNAASTVYRAVRALEESGSLERVGERDGRALFVSCSQQHHHHHVVCERCGRVSLADCPLAAVAPEGFTITRHDVTIYGVCAACASKGLV